MASLCSGCLSGDRKMVPLQDIKYSHIFTQILNEIYVYDITSAAIMLCWECRATLRRIQHFKQQVKWSYNRLLQEAPKISTSHLSTSEVYNVSYPDCVVKEEDSAMNEVKSEGDSTHCEPEAFVHDLDIEYEPEKKTKKKLKKSSKIKVKKKIKETKGKTDFDETLKEDVDANLEMTDKQDICDSVNDPSPEPHVRAPPPRRTREVLPDKPQCTDCGKMFSSKKTYRYHRNVIHKGQNQHPCPRCGKIYQWKSNLGRHMRTHKAVDNGELYCDKCDKSFASVATYRQHLKITKTHVSESEFSFVCNECGKKFATQTRLRDHIDWDHLNKIKFKCELCNKSFKSYTSLYVHTQHFHKNKAKKDNLCHVCGKSYQNAAKLKYHITALHSGETPHRCTHCAAAFGWYTSLYRHVREVHYKIKLNPKKVKKQKKSDIPDLIFAPNFVVPAPGPS